jgi:hypothetical protein
VIEVFSIVGYLCLFLVIPESRAQNEWAFELVDNGKMFDMMSEQSLIVDAEGHSHIAYGEDFLYYARFDGVTWHHETADTTPLVGYYASMALGPRGYPHISYRDHERCRLKYAYKDEEGWHSETVFPNLGSGEYCSIEVDGRGQPHISYYDGTLRYVHRDGPTWHLTIVDNSSTGPVGLYSSLELDNKGYPHISYYDKSNDYVKYAYMDSNGWHKEVVGPSGDDELGTSLELDADGIPHIGYFGIHSVKYAYKGDEGWHIETIEGSPGDPSGAFPSLELDTAGNPGISYRGPGPTLRYAYNDGSGWVVEIATDATDGKWTSLSLDPTGSPHVMCTHPSHLDYNYKDAEGWHRMWADDKGISGKESWMALDSGGNPHVCYMARDDEEVRYAVRESEGWRIEIVEIPPDESVKFPTIDVTANGDPHLCYSVTLDEVIRYAYKYGQNWQYEDVNPSWAIAGFSALSLDTNLQPHLCYYEFMPSPGFKYGYREISGWLIETVSDNEHTRTSLRIDSQEYPHISSHRTPEDDLNYIYKDEQGWHIETVDSYGGVGYYTSLAIDALDRPHIGYLDWTNLDLKYAYKDESGWHLEIADAEGGAGWYCSLDLDGAGNPHLAYIAIGDSELRYAYKDEEGWHIESIFPYWCGGENHCITLVLDEHERPHIVYHNEALNDLMYVYKPGPPQLHLSGEIEDVTLMLTWNTITSASAYWVYGDETNPFFKTGFGPSYENRLAILDPAVTSWSSGSGVGDPGENWTYLVMAVDETESELAHSNRVGEVDYLNDIP